MAATPPDPAPAATPSRWVWRCSDTSIAAGQYSVLALLETLIVFALYIWLAFHFERQWWLLLSAVAAPIILLRSEESKALGVALLKRYNDGLKRKQLSRDEAILLLGLALSIVLVLAGELAQTWLPEHAGWALWSDAALVTTICVVAIDIAITVIGAVAGARSIAIIRAVKSNISPKPPTITLLPILSTSFGIGVWSRSLGIRVYASLHHPLVGLRRLPHNWWEILFTVDFLHPPELLPGAGQVSKLFTIAGCLTTLKSADTSKQIIICTLIPVWYIPALLWRWSLKATLWLWWPLALLLRPPLDGVPTELVRDQAANRVYGPGRWLGVPALLLPAWVALSQWPDWKTWLEPWHDAWWQQLLMQLLTLAPPPPGLRLAALLLCCGLTLVCALKASGLKAVHKQPLEEEGTFAELPASYQARLAQRARHLERWHTAQVVAFILLGYSVALWLAQAHYPTEAARFIPAWLLGYL